MVFFHRAIGIAGMVMLALVLAACGNRNIAVPTPTPAQSMDEDAEQGTQPTSDAADSDRAERDTGSDTLVNIAVESSLLDRKSAQPGVGDPAPDFSYTMPDGTVHKLSDHRGKKILINFWATWCPPCKAEMPDIQEAANRFEDENFMVLALSQDVETHLIEPFAREKQLTIPLIPDPQGEIARTYGARGLPTSFFVHPDGTISSGVMGMLNIDSIQEHLDKME